MSKGRKKPISSKMVNLNVQLQRRSGVRKLSKRFLIVCEDVKSAPNYFRALKKCENLDATSVAVFGSNGKTQPAQVVQSAIDLQEVAADRSSGTEPFDEVWCVIDGDCGANIKHARTMANTHKIKLAISTMCFEYWVLLHFDKHHRPAGDCNAVVRTLKKYHCPQYAKGTCDFVGIVPHARDASARAKKLRRTQDLPESQNPCSDLYLLIDAMLAAVSP